MPILIFSVSYISLKALDDYDYNMSRKFLKFQKNDNYKNGLNLNFLLDYKDVDVIVETNKRDTIGVYNPTMIYYINSSKVRSLGTFRYFSTNDYKTKSNTAIYFVEDLDNFNNIEIEKLSENSGFNIINIFLEDSAIYKSGVKFVVNLFSLDSSDITKIYVDSKNENSLNEVRERFLNIGFSDINTSEKATIFKIAESVLYNRYNSFVFFNSFMGYLLFCYSYCIYLSKYKKYINLYLSYGATLTIILKNKIKVFGLLSIISFSASYILSKLYFNYLDLNYLDMLDYLSIFIFVTLTVLIITSIMILVMYVQNKKVMR